MDNEENLKKNMTDILLNLKLKDFDTKIITNNIQDIEYILEKMDLENNRHKYLCLSCIYGAFLGDSMGSCCEFSRPSPNNCKFIFKIKKGIFDPGEVTDDSEMAISAAFAYIDSFNEDPSIIQDIIYYYFCIWRYTGPKDIGNATSNALRYWKKNDINETTFNYKMVKGFNWESLANGFLMRISTFIAYYYYTHLDIIYSTINKFFEKEIKEISQEIINLYYDIYKESLKNTEITHPNFECGISSAVFSLLTLTGMVTNEASKVYSLFNLITKCKIFFDCHEDKLAKTIAKQTQKKYVTILEEIESGKKIEVFNLMGYYIHGFKLSIFYIKYLSDLGNAIGDNVYYDIMCEVCNYGGDTDTNCAIVGAMIGPLIGYKKFGSEYFEKFINFIPESRIQFNSAFMYIYVSFLEEKCLGKDKTGETDEEEDNTKIGEKTNNSKDDDKLEKSQKSSKENKSSGIMNTLSGWIYGQKIEKFKHYTALKKIMEFLTKEIEI